MLDKYDMVICHRAGHTSFRFLTPQYEAIGWCLCAVFYTWNDGRLATVIEQMSAVKDGNLDRFGFGGSEIDVTITKDQVEIVIPYQDSTDLTRDTTFVAPFSEFFDAVNLWSDFLRRVSYKWSDVDSRTVSEGREARAPRKGQPDASPQ